MRKSPFRFLPFVLVLAFQAAASASAPNFILILSDDQGWTHTAARMDKNNPDSRSDFFQTPHLEKMAAAGMRFSRGYAPAQVCSPTRYSIQFGKTPARIGHTKVNANLENVDHTQRTLPQLLKAANPDYAAAHFGKWHIKAEPEDFGYDESDGKTRNQEGNYNIQYEDKWSGVPHEDPKLIFALTERSKDFISRKAEAAQPFYLQISHYANHGAIIARKEIVEKYESLPKGSIHQHTYYAAMNEDLDRGVGAILDHVESLGLSDSTYIIFTADNGGLPIIPPYQNLDPEIGQNYPLSRGKWDLTEGGIRVPFIVTGPGIEPNSQSDTPVVGYDLLPTILDLAGGEERLPDSFDGRSIAPALHGAEEIERDGKHLVFHAPHYNRWGLNEPHSALIDGDFKLVHLLVSDRFFLFNVASDPGEREDLTAQHPELANKLKSYLLGYLKEVGAETVETSPTWKANQGTTSTKFPFGGE